MTEVRQYLESRNERLITIPREKEVSDFSLGDCEYDSRGVDCNTERISTLYHKLCCNEYDAEFKSTYKTLDNHVVEFTQSETLAVGSEQIEGYIEAMFHSDVFEKDIDFHQHVDEEYNVPNETPDNSKKHTLAKIWLLYLAERGVE